jgi:hypothetical protein
VNWYLGIDENKPEVMKYSCDNVELVGMLQ